MDLVIDAESRRNEALAWDYFSGFTQPKLLISEGSPGPTWCVGMTAHDIELLAHL